MLYVFATPASAAPASISALDTVSTCFVGWFETISGLQLPTPLGSLLSSPPPQAAAPGSDPIPAAAASAPKADNRNSLREEPISTSSWRLRRRRCERLSDRFFPHDSSANDAPPPLTAPNQAAECKGSQEKGYIVPSVTTGRAPTMRGNAVPLGRGLAVENGRVEFRARTRKLNHTVRAHARTHRLR